MSVWRLMGPQPAPPQDMLHASILPHEDTWRRLIYIFPKSADELISWVWGQIPQKPQACRRGRTSLLPRDVWQVGQSPQLDLKRRQPVLSVLGSHVAQVTRRLRRVCAAVGSK